MDEAKSYRSHVRERGQLTIPKEVREKGTLCEGDAVSIIPIGDSILITPQKIELDEARRALRKIMRDSGLTIEQLLGGLSDVRKSQAEGSDGEKTT